MNFTKALIRNIEKTYSYAYVKNTGRYEGNPSNYEAVSFFMYLLTKENPFKVFMELERYAFVNAKKALIKYGIPYTPEQERAAKVFSDVTTQMVKQRRDCVSMYVEDLEGTGIIKVEEPFVLTTKDTLYVSNEIKRLPRSRTVLNVLYDNELPSTLKDSHEQYSGLKRV